MTDPLGGIYSSEDADSEGEEGKFYLWTPGEIQAVLGAEAARTFCRVYDVSEAGNFEGRNILHLSRPLETEAKMLGREPALLVAELAAARPKLLAARANARPPGTRRKSAGQLEQPGHRRFGPSGRGAGRTSLHGGGRRGGRFSARRICVTATADCSTAGAAARPNTTPISTITPAWAMPW